MKNALKLDSCEGFNDQIEKMLGDKAEHPFEDLHSVAWPLLLSNILAVYQALPFLRSGAMKDVVLERIFRNSEIEESDELTAVVASFFSWDDSGGHRQILKNGNSGLVELLNTREQFRSNLFRRDVYRILGHELRAEYSKPTREFLWCLNRQLSSGPTLNRAGAMIALEFHERNMRQALWKSLSREFKVERSGMKFFKEKSSDELSTDVFSIELSMQLIQRLMGVEEGESFFAYFKECYDQNIQWCELLKKL